jgi:hypothetical protein
MRRIAGRSAAEVAASVTEEHTKEVITTCVAATEVVRTHFHMVVGDILVSTVGITRLSNSNHNKDNRRFKNKAMRTLMVHRAGVISSDDGSRGHRRLALGAEVLRSKRNMRLSSGRLPFPYVVALESDLDCLLDLLLFFGAADSLKMVMRAPARI